MTHRILVVEDLPLVGTMLGSVLRSFASEYDATVDVEVVQDAGTALERLEREPAQLVVTDVHLRGLDGIELVRRLRATPSLAKVPVLVVTGGHADEGERARAAGADAFLEKPFRLPVLFDTVTQLMGLPRRSTVC